MPVTTCYNHSTSWMRLDREKILKILGVHMGPSISSFSGWMGKSQLTIPRGRWENWEENWGIARLKNLRFRSIFRTMHWNWIMVTLWWTNIAMENGHRNSGFSHEKWWFSIAMLVHQRVHMVTTLLENGVEISIDPTEPLPHPGTMAMAPL